MILYFKDGPPGSYGEGYYKFYLAAPEHEDAIVFRMPVDAPKSERIERARNKLFYRYQESLPFQIHEAEEVHVVWWLMEHRKKADLGEDSD